MLRFNFEIKTFELIDFNDVKKGDVILQRSNAHFPPQHYYLDIVTMAKWEDDQLTVTSVPYNGTLGGLYE